MHYLIDMHSAAATTGKPAPSRWWYLLAGAIVLAGFAGMAAFIFPRLQAMNDALIQVVVPGETEMTLDKPGTYTIFHEERSVVGDRVYVSDNISGLRVTVTSASTGKQVPVGPTALSETYTLGSRSGKSIFAFDITEPGAYRLAADYEDGRAQPQAVLAVGHGFLSSLLLTVFGSLGIVFACIAAAVAIVISVWRRRAAAVRDGAGTAHQ